MSSKHATMSGEAERQFWLGMRDGLLRMVDAIERGPLFYDDAERTAALRREVKAFKAVAEAVQGERQEQS